MCSNTSILSYLCCMDVLTIIISAIGSVGGLELIKWIWTRNSNKRLASAKADMAEIEAETAEFRLLRERLELADEQLLKKEERMQEQTELVRELNKQLLESVNKIGALQARISTLEAERKMKLCEVRGCMNRQPQSGY